MARAYIKRETRMAKFNRIELILLHKTRWQVFSLKHYWVQRRGCWSLGHNQRKWWSNRPSDTTGNGSCLSVVSSRIIIIFSSAGYERLSQVNRRCHRGGKGISNGKISEPIGGLNDISDIIAQEVRRLEWRFISASTVYTVRPIRGLDNTGDKMYATAPTKECIAKNPHEVDKARLKKFDDLQYVIWLIQVFIVTIIKGWVES